MLWLIFLLKSRAIISKSRLEELLYLMTSLTGSQKPLRAASFSFNPAPEPDALLCYANARLPRLIVREEVSKCTKAT